MRAREISHFWTVFFEGDFLDFNHDAGAIISSSMERRWPEQ